MQHNAPFCVLLKKTFLGRGRPNPSTAFSLSRVGMYDKCQCLEKVNVKYVIKRLWHEIFHIAPGINPRPISALQLRCRAWYGSLGIIPGPIWKMSCNNLIVYKAMIRNDSETIVNFAPKSSCQYHLSSYVGIHTISR